MKERIHTLKAEIKEIESLLDNLSGPMLELATEELKNLRFEMDMLNRSLQRVNSLNAPIEKHLEGELSH